MLRTTFLLTASLLASGAAISASAMPAAAADVSVLYAGSLVNLMEHGVGVAFDAASGETFHGFAGGSNGLANQIKGKLRRGDVFLSATPNVNDTLMGPGNGDWVKWYVGFAQSPVVIGYNPKGRFAAEFKTKPWYEVLREPGIRIGRTDPKLDPKGALTVRLMDHAAEVYHQPDLAKAVLGAPGNPDQVQLEESLVGRLQSGELDAGFFYSTETSDLKIPAIPLPPEVALSAHYTVTVLRDAANPAGAAKFVNFLLSQPGRDIMRTHGLETPAPAVGGDAAALPEAVHLK